MIVGHRVLSRNLAAILLMQMRKKSPKQVVFNIRDLARTTDLVLTLKPAGTSKSAFFSARKLAVLVLPTCYQNRRSGFSRFAG